MNADIDRLRREADEHLQRFSASLEDARRFTQPKQLVDGVFRTLDPEMRLMRRIETAVRRHPAIAIATLFGVSWLAAQALNNGHAAMPDRIRRRRKLLTFMPQKTTGDLSHGYDEFHKREGEAFDHSQERGINAQGCSGPKAQEHSPEQAERTR
jgi:hypothetical protein